MPHHRQYVAVSGNTPVEINLSKLSKLNNKEKILEGWNLNIDEVSNGVYKMEFIDDYGRIVSCTDHDFERGMETCVNYAFDIEKQITKNWNKFLFDVIKFKLKKNKLDEEVYQNEVFGSSLFKQNNRRIIIDGKDTVIEFQKKTILRIWKTKKQISLENLEYKDLQKMCEEFE